MTGQTNIADSSMDISLSYNSTEQSVEFLVASELFSDICGELFRSQGAGRKGVISTSAERIHIVRSPRLTDQINLPMS